MTPKIDEEIVVASRLYGRISIRDSRTGAAHRKGKEHCKQKCTGKGRGKWKCTNGKRGQMSSRATGGILVQHRQLWCPCKNSFMYRSAPASGNAVATVDFTAGIQHVGKVQRGVWRRQMRKRSVKGKIF